MKYRDIVGFTPNMGPFEIVDAWNMVPQALKDKLPQAIKDAIDAVSTIVGIYNGAMTLVTAANKALDLAKQIKTAASLPPDSTVPIAIGTKIAMKMSADQFFNQLTNVMNPLSGLMDQEIPI